MSKNSKVFVRGEELLLALSGMASFQFVKLISVRDKILADPKDPGIVSINISAQQAHQIARSGDYEGEVKSGGRVIKIRPVYSTPPPKDIHYWAGRSCVRFHKDFRSIPETRKNRESVDLWNRMLQKSPAPSSWK